MLLLGGVSLYLLAPKLISVLASWPQLKTLKPGWFGLALLFESLSYLSLWSMQRVALHATSWFAVGTAQLASGAIASMRSRRRGHGGTGRVPDAHQGRHPRRGRRLGARGLGDRQRRRSSARCRSWRYRRSSAAWPRHAASSRPRTSALPASSRWRSWRRPAFGWDRPLLIVGRAARWLIQRVKRDSAADLPDRLLAQRDRMKETFGHRWLRRARGRCREGRLRLPRARLLSRGGRGPAGSVGGAARVRGRSVARADPGDPRRPRLRRGRSDRDADGRRHQRARRARLDARLQGGLVLAAAAGGRYRLSAVPPSLRRTRVRTRARPGSDPGSDESATSNTVP